ncbi:MAG: CDP-glycerol:glycerophosphate glycerophosphotransferase [Lachnospiraceae bacterium]|nr:CDP-glycerol:glycerophosphate glycerophosphotransferase [Lachnospiraceae bacterium]
MTEQRRYKISVVTAVYNVRPYLEEMIQSILWQTIGLDNIQLILIDDGSFDGSETICDYYAAQYPNNILTIHKENGGVSSARNEGLRHVQGDYVNFTDADDLLAMDALEKMYRFIEKNCHKIDLVVIPLKCYGLDERHPLDYKFTRTRLVNLDKEYSSIQLSISSALVKNECFRNRRFDSELSYAEDAQLLTDILLDKMCYGIVCGTGYQYRKRISNDSATDRGRIEKSYYIPYMKNFILFTLKNAEQKKGNVPLFVQYICMYDLQWRLTNPLTEPGILNSLEEQEYRELLLQAIRRIDDCIIWKQKSIGYDEKMRLLSLKKEGEAHAVIFLEFLTITQKQIQIEGYVRNALHIGKPELICQLVSDTGNSIAYKAGLTEKKDERCFGETLGTVGAFCLRINRAALQNQTDIYFVLHSEEEKITCTDIRFEKFFPLSERFPNSYLYEAGLLLFYISHRLCIVNNPKRYQIRRQERKLSKDLLSGKDGQAFRGWTARRIYHLLKPFKKKELWLIGDRITKADDNGEAFFTYMNTEGRDCDIVTYFVLDKCSKDYERLTAVGRVVPYHSLRHKILSLLCDKKVSSQADEYAFNRFFDMVCMLKDIQHRQTFIFLQHGITKDDSSTWLKRSDVNIRLFITATHMECQSILDFPYGYDENSVRCTGFPRYDYLYDAQVQERIITFMPTWRLYLTGGYDDHADMRKAKGEFRESAYCRMYREVFSDPRLLEAVKSYGYTIQVMPHPAMPWECFAYLGCGDQIKVLERHIRYREVFAASRMIITDYSSAVFDFAYLRKPVLYYQPDIDEFFSGKHVYRKGYFDYERDGFGEISYTAPELVEQIIAYMQNGCQMKEMYRERVERTFPYNDCRNCKRVYEEIKKL